MSVTAALIYRHGPTMTGFTPVDRALLALVLRQAKVDGTYDETIALVMDRRADFKRDHLRWQRKWQTNVSRRPQRGRSHDSWDIREQYVRCHASTDFPSAPRTGHALWAAHRSDPNAVAA